MNIRKSGNHGFVIDPFGIGLDTDTGTGEAGHVFISHAHADHVPRNRKGRVYATPPTAALMRTRGFTGEITPVAFFEPVGLPGATVTLYPAGHILGSALTFVETAEGNVLYTGDFRTPPSPASEGFQLPAHPVDFLITEATFSLPIYRWKPHDEIFAMIRKFAEETLSEEATPVYLCYNLGKAQEVMMALAPLKVPLRIHPAGFPLCKVYEEFGFQLGGYEKSDGTFEPGTILIAPSAILGTREFETNPKKRVAYCSGWAALESRRAQMPVDKLIPISDHADFFAILDVCKELSPKHTLITHTPNADVLMHYMRRMGLSVSAA